MEELRSLEDLLDLQVVDLEIDRLLNDRQSLPELEEYRAAHALSGSLGAEKQTADATLRETTLELDKNSGELELAELKLAAEQNRLYAGGLSARDANFLRQEVEMLGRQNSEMEDLILELLDRREAEESIVNDFDTRIAVSDAEKKRLEAMIKEAWKGIDARLAKKEARKADIIPLITEYLLELYDELREIKQGVAVGRLAEDICGGCHLRLTPAERLDISKSDPPRCIHCRRILVI